MGNAFSCLHGPVELEADVQHAHDKATPASPVKGAPAASYSKAEVAAAQQQGKGSEEAAAAKETDNDTGGLPELGKESGKEIDPNLVSAMFPSTGGYPYQGYELGPPPTYDEPARLQALRAVDVLDSVTTGRGVRLDEEAALVLATVMKAFRAATAMLVFIGESRIIVRNSLGIVPTGEFPYRWSLCAYTLSKQHPQTLVIPDASKDVRFADNPFVAKAPGVRFYAGAPVLSSSGQALGTLCFADTSPRPNFDAGQCRLLNNLAEVVARAVERLGPGAGVAGSKDAETTALARVARTTECFEAVTGLVDVGSGAPGAAGAQALGRSRSMRSRGGAPGSQGGWVVMYVNEAWEALVEGRSRRSMVGRPLQQLLELEAEPRGEAGEQGEAGAATPAEAAGIPVSATPSLTSVSSRPSTPESLTTSDPKPSNGLLPHSPRSPHHPNGFPIRKLRSVSLRLREGKTHYRRSTSFAGSATSSARSRASPKLCTRPVDAAAAARWAEAAAAARAGQVVDLGRVRLLTADGKPTGKRAFMQLRPANSHILDAATRMPVGIPPQLALPASILEAAPPPAPGSPAPGSPSAAHTAATHAAAALHDGSVHFSSLDGAVSGQPPPPAPSAPSASAPQVASGASSRFAAAAAAAAGSGSSSGTASDATDSTPPASGGSQRAAPSPAAVSRSEPGAVGPSAGPCYCFVTLTPLPDEDDEEFDADGDVGRISEEHATAPASPPLAVPTTPSTSVRLPALCSTANAGGLPSATTRPGSITSGAMAAGSSRRGGGGAGGSVPGDPTSGWTYGDEPLPGLRLGHLLGKGGYGKVFSATYRGEKVAAKVVSNSMLYAAASVNNVSLEALMAQEIEHPFLVRTIKCVVRMYGTGGSGELDTPGHSVHVSPSAPSPLSVIPALVAPPPPSNGASGDPPTPSFATTTAPANTQATNAAPVISSAKPPAPPPGGQPLRPGSLDLPSQGLPPPSTPSLLASGLEMSDALAQAGRSLPSEALNAARSPAPGIAAAAGAVAAGMAATEAAQAAAPAPPAPPPPPAALPAPPASEGPAVAAQQQQQQQQRQQQSPMEFDSFDMVSGQETSESCGMVVSMIDHLSPGGMGLGGHHLPPSALAHTAPTIYEDAELTDTDPLPICGGHVGGAASAASHVVCPPGTGAAHSRAHPATPMLPSPMHPGRPGASWRPADGPIGHASAPQRRSVDLGSRGSAGGVVSPGVVVPAAGITAAAAGGARGSGGGPSGGTQGASSASQGRGGPKLAEGETWFVMEFCSRGTLQDAIDQGHLRTEPSRLRGEPHLPHILLTAQEVASAMGCLHSRGYLHGDLSAVNVLLADVSQAAAAAGVAAAAGPAPALLAGPASSRGWVAKVSDLGLAKGLPEPDAVHVSAVCGVITHCAPEVLRSHMQTQKSDVYSFGVLLWQCWTGSRPFSGMNRFQILGAVTSASGPPLRFLPSQRPPRRYEDLTLRCLSPNPQDRPSFVEVVEDIRQLIVEVAAAGLLQA